MNIQKIKSIYNSCWLALLVIFTYSCNQEEAPDCFQSAGEITTIKRETGEFKFIELRDYIQYEFFDSNAYFVEITAPKNLIPEIATDVSEEKLTVENHNSCNFVRSYKHRINVRIYAPEFSNIQHFATGDIRSVNTLTGQSLKLENRNAAGKISLDVDMDSVTIATHTGVCDVEVKGRSQITSLFNQGVGIIDARRLITTDAFVNNSSINDVYVNTNGYFYALVVYSGNIFYTGTPNHIDSDIEGNGKVEPIE